MKHILTGFAAALTAFVSLGAASPAAAQYQAPTYGAALPPFEVMTIIRSMGFDPISRPVLRGPVYVVQALDDEGISVRVLVDAQRGNVIRVTESRPASVYAGLPPEAGFGPRRSPPETVPPGAVYRPYEETPAPQAAHAPSPPRPKVATRTPLPRPAPPHSKAGATPPPVAGATAAIPDANKTPGKSIPAPVANKSATTADPIVTGSTAAPHEQSKSESTNTAATPDVKSTVTVPPVAPLE